MFLSLSSTSVPLEMLAFSETTASAKSGPARKNWWIWCSTAWGPREPERLGTSAHILMTVGFPNYTSPYDKWPRVSLEASSEKKMSAALLLLDGFFAGIFWITNRRLSRKWIKNQAVDVLSQSACFDLYVGNGLFHVNPYFIVGLSFGKCRRFIGQFSTLLRLPTI